MSEIVGEFDDINLTARVNELAQLEALLPFCKVRAKTAGAFGRISFARRSLKGDIPRRKNVASRMSDRKQGILGIFL